MSAAPRPRARRLAQIAASVAAGWAVDGEAHAGACCAGTTTGVPGRLGPLETVLVGVDLGGEAAIARWRADRSLTNASPQELAVTGQLAGALRFAPRFQLIAGLPLRWGVRRAGGLTDAGGGLGDATFTTFTTLGEERVPNDGRRGLPALTLIVGARFPTGRSWTESQTALLADVTGRPGVGLRAGLLVEHTMTSHPWFVQVDADLPLPDGVPLLTATAGVGRTFGVRWTLMGTLAWQHGFGGAPSERTTLGVRVVRGERLAWRAWGGLGLDVPIPGLGQENPVQATLSVGAAWVH